MRSRASSARGGAFGGLGLGAQHGLERGLARGQGLDLGAAVALGALGGEQLLAVQGGEAADAGRPRPDGRPGPWRGACSSGAMARIRMAARTVSTALSAGTSSGGGGRRLIICRADSSRP